MNLEYGYVISQLKNDIAGRLPTVDEEEDAENYGSEA